MYFHGLWRKQPNQGNGHLKRKSQYNFVNAMKEESQDALEILIMDT